MIALRILIQAWPFVLGQLAAMADGVIDTVTSFTFMALLIARLGTSITGGHQIAINAPEDAAAKTV